MESYILKSALVAEIEKRIKETESMHPKFDQFWAGQISAFNGVLKILGTIEVKGVDLKEEFYDFLDTLTGKDNGRLSEDELFRIAEYFFELGLSVSNKVMKGE